MSPIAGANNNSFKMSKQKSTHSHQLHIAGQVSERPRYPLPQQAVVRIAGGSGEVGNVLTWWVTVGVGVGVVDMLIIRARDVRGRCTGHRAADFV